MTATAMRCSSTAKASVIVSEGLRVKNCGACELEGCVGTQYNGANTNLRSFTYTPNAYGLGKLINCFRLFIWDLAYHDGTRYYVRESCLRILLTGKKLTRDAYDGPFRSERPTDAEPDAGTLLNYEPYWWPSCGIGGWAKTSNWWRPTAGNLATVYGIIAADAGVDMPAAGVKHTLILYMKFWRYKMQVVLGNRTGPINGTGTVWPGVGVDTIDADSNAVLRAVHLTCPTLSA